MKDEKYHVYYPAPANHSFILGFDNFRSNWPRIQNRHALSSEIRATAHFDRFAFILHISYFIIFFLSYHPKLLTIDPITRAQPSTRMNSRILKGSEIMTGGSIIIPMDMSTEATTMSTTRNGI
jgi:hypothetical protein